MKILTFDIEDWFHILETYHNDNYTHWEKYEKRIHLGTNLILDLLEKYEQKATFFCLGWVAETYPEIIKKISKQGHEIGTHTHYHQLVFSQTRSTFKGDLDRSIQTIEQLTGIKVKYFRAPGFSITQSSLWAFEALINAGIEVDCSVFPTHRAHGGLPGFLKPEPARIQVQGSIIKELPINYYSITGTLPVVFSGGGYFRLLPYKFIKLLTQKSDYLMSYFHPRDFDPDQPILEGLSAIKKFKSYVGLNNTHKKLCNWLEDFEFMEVGTAIKRIDWEKTPIIKI